MIKQYIIDCLANKFLQAMFEVAYFNIQNTNYYLSSKSFRKNVGKQLIYEVYSNGVLHNEIFNSTTLIFIILYRMYLYNGCCCEIC